MKALAIPNSSPTASALALGVALREVGEELARALGDLGEDARGLGGVGVRIAAVRTCQAWE